MVDIRQVVASWFVMLNQNTYVLIRIESLVALVTLMFLVMFVLDIFRYQYLSSTMTTIMKIVDDLSDHIIVYLLGAMSSANFGNPLFPVWAVVLVSLRYSLSYLSGYGIKDRLRQIRQFTLAIQLMGAGILNVEEDSLIKRSLWSLWAILALKSLYRNFAHDRAIQSLWHSRSTEFLPEYLHQHAASSVDLERYLVYGEAEQKTKTVKPQYRVELDVTSTTKGSLVTLASIDEACSQTHKHSSNKYKDMSLAFTLSRLLRCRLEDVPLHSETISSTRDLVVSKVINYQNAEQKLDAGQAFKILELELAFVRDYFYTLYPVVFWRGLSSLLLSILLSAASFAIAFWLAVDIRKFYSLPMKTAVDFNHSNQTTQRHKDKLVLRKGRWNVDVIITWVFMFFMMFKEAWEVTTYLVSNWTRLLLVCWYVQKKSWFMWTECLTGSFFTSKIADPWHGRISQYNFLQSCTYRPIFWKLAHYATLGLGPKKSDGKKEGDAIKVPECVKVAILQELRRMKLTAGDLLPSDSLLNSFEKHERPFLKLKTCSQAILVWHIATSLCEIKLAQDKKIDLNKPGFWKSIWLFLTKMCCSQPFLVNENILKEKHLRTNYSIANSLSRYCAYLLAFQPEMLPDSFTVPGLAFSKTLEHAFEELGDCNLKRCRYGKLMAAPQRRDGEDGQLNIVQQGAMLARDLIDKKDEKERWRILAGVWAKLLVHIAPSWNAEVHKYRLESGGEFITLIWALLWHCGIEKSSMWHEDNEAVTRSNSQAPQEITTGTGNAQPVEEQASEDRVQSCEGVEDTTGREGGGQDAQAAMVKCLEVGDGAREREGDPEEQAQRYSKGRNGT